ncbi:sigma-70 family RNA polymerase sigma factor [Candidatus Poribacteria bacterium]|nr:sigma-70 family RNA polymerase sigma factor [Candidatus Poribacteria bacterium]
MNCAALTISNEVALIAHQKRDKVEDRNEVEFLAWLREIAQNVIRNWSRREGRVAMRIPGSLNNEDFFENFAQSIESDAPSPEMLVLNQERIQMIRKAISQLPLIHQQVIWLFYVEELPENKIANRLGIRKGTVKSRLHTARQRLAVFLEPYIME